MPCDGSIKSQKDFELDLAEIVSCCSYLEHHASITAGKFNMDLSHYSSVHTKLATNFLLRHSFHLPSKASVEYIFESKSNGENAWINNFFESYCLKEITRHYTI